MDPQVVTAEDVRALLVENTMLKVRPSDIKEESPLFGPDSLGLDSIDALQLVMAIENKYGIAIKNAAEAKEIFKTVGTIVRWLNQQNSQK